MVHQLFLEARDLLYFRDGRSVNDGSGAAWPSPSTAYSALLSAFHRTWTIPQEWEMIPDWGKRGSSLNGRFGGLKTFGPLPSRDGKIYVPTPADLRSHSIAAPIRNVPGKANFPAAVRYGIGSPEGASKETPNRWISMDDFERYRTGDFRVETLPDQAFFNSEARTGIALDEKGCAKDGMIYFSSYLRLYDDVRMCLFAECDSICDSTRTDVIDRFFQKNPRRELLFGGQRGVVYTYQETFDSAKKANLLPPCKGKGHLVKWILLSPAIYSNGWLPKFIDPASGKVLLRKCPRLNRRDFPSREAMQKQRLKNSEEIRAYLVAAALPKTQHYSGWNMQKQRPESTKLVVPPGSVYYFEAETEHDAALLSEVLSGNRYSDFYGPHGFGVGVCAPFEYYDFNLISQ